MSFSLKILSPCLLAGLLFLQSNLLFAQTTGQDEALFHPFLDLGLSSSQVSGDGLSGFNQLGLSGGAGVEVNIEGRWKPRMELLFVQKGSRKNARPDEGDFESYLLRLNYIELPLTIGYTAGSTGFELGMSGAYLLNHVEENENGTILGINREFKHYDLSGLLGIRYAFHERWELGTRFSQSFVAIRDHAGSSSFRLNQGQYNSSIQFLLRFRV